MAEHEEKRIVIKYGGSALDDTALRTFFLKDLRCLLEAGWQILIAHGGGPRINALLDRLHIESHFENGLRVTDAATLEAVEMALCGQVNKELTRLFLQASFAAVGISGQDGAMLECVIKNPALGFVGEISQVNPKLPLALLDQGFLPIVAPLGLGPDYRACNVNADTAAAALAAALKARAFVLISDVPGVLDADGSLLAFVSEKAVHDLMAARVVSGGMIPKLQACLTAKKGGCQRAFILDGRQPGALKKFVEDQAQYGTEVVI